MIKFIANILSLNLKKNIMLIIFNTLKLFPHALKILQYITKSNNIYSFLP